MPETGLDRWGRGFLRIVGWTAGVALVVVFALYVELLGEFRHHSPPNVAGISRSQPVVDADHAAASETSAGLRALIPGNASWLVAGPTAVSDLCVSNSVSYWTQSWTPTICTRTVTAFFFFNGSFQEHMQAWDAALRAAGWSADAHPLSQPLSDYSQFGHRPEPNEPGRTYLATSLRPSGEYIRAFGGSPGRAVGLMFRWAERPQASPSFVRIDSSPVPGPDTAIAWIQKPAVSLDAVESAAFPRYQFVAVATLTLRAGYYDSSAPVQGPAPNSAGGSCVTGSDTCN